MRPGGAAARIRALAGAQGLDATTATQIVTIAGPAQAATRKDRDKQAGASASVVPASGTAAGNATAGRAAAADGQVTAPGQDSARDVVPDLMATPVFADLRMPGPGGTGRDAGPGAAAGTAGSAGPGQRADKAAGASTSGPAASQRESWLLRARGFGDLIKSRRGLVLTAPLAATAIVAGIVFLAFPGLGDKLFKGLALHPGGTGSVTRSVTSGKPGHAAPGNARRTGTRTGTGTHHAGGPAASPGGSGTPGSPSHGSSAPPSPAGRPSPSGQPSPSVSPSGSPSASPSPSTSSPVTTSGKLPLGYAWQSVTASSVGTIAGWRLGAPASWVLSPGVQSYISNPAGAARIGVDLAQFPGATPVRAARHLQAAAIAHGSYPRYHLVSILPRRFHGWPAATWTFWWKPAGKPVIDVTKTLFTSTTSAGPQPYDISMAAPASHASYASHVLAVALRTFSPLP